MLVRDDLAVQLLIAFGARQRIVIVWWHLKNWREVGVTPGFQHAMPDKNALALEIFGQYMAQIETLEMTYFALRDKMRSPRRSFLCCYEEVEIREHFKLAMPHPKSYSGRRMLFELRGMGVRRLQRELGIPTYEELEAAACGKPAAEPRITKREYHAELRELIQWMRQAVANKKHRWMHKAFVKMKHGFIVLGHPESGRLYIVQDTKQRSATTCLADVLPFKNTEETLARLEEETQKIGWTVIRLLGLYLRRCPWNSCDGCNQAGHCETDGAKESPASS